MFRYGDQFVTHCEGRVGRVLASVWREFRGVWALLLFAKGELSRPWDTTVRATTRLLEIEVGRQTAGRQRAKKPQTAPQHVFQLWSKHKIPLCSNPNPTINSPPTASEPATSMKITFSDLRGAEGAGFFFDGFSKVRLLQRVSRNMHILSLPAHPLS